MESKSSNVKARPPVLLDRLVCFLTPPAAREEVVGDLWERYSSPLQYTSQALQILPFVIASQIRRSSSLPVMGLQLFILFACFGGFEIAVTHPPLWAQAAVPTLAAVTGLVVRDAYRTTEQRTLRRAVLDTMSAAACIVLSQVLLAGLIALNILDCGWVLDLPLAVLGTLALPVLCVLRGGSSHDGVSKSSHTQGCTSAQGLVRDYLQFQRSVRWRNRVEIAALVLVIGGSAFLPIHFNPRFAPAGWVMLAGFAALAVNLAVKGSARSLPDGIGFTPLRTLYQAELARQHQLRRLMWWFWLVPLFAGLIVKLVARGFRSDRPQLTVLGVGVIALLCFCIAGLNRDRGRQVRDKIGALAAAGER